MEAIKSKNNELIKKIKKLMDSHRYRQKEGLFVLEGARLCFDALHSEYEAVCFLFCESAQKKYAAQCAAFCARAQNAFLITDEIAQKLSDTQSAQGVFAVLKMKAPQTLPPQPGKYIAFDCVQNPLNLGAAVRTADALGAAGAIFHNGCDIYNPKALRASMGSMLRLPMYISENLTEDLKAAQAQGCTIYSAVPGSAAFDVRATAFSDFSICVIGNEANGISQSVLDISDRLVTIRMKSEAESLNALAAASIILWEMMKG